MRFTRFVSLSQRHLIGFRTQITPLDVPATVHIQSGIDGRVTSTGTQHFLEGDKRMFEGTIMRMVSKTVQSDVSCCLHAAFHYSQAADRVLPSIGRRYLGTRTWFELDRGETLTAEKLAAVTTSRDLEYDGLQDAAERALQDGLQLLKSALEKGYDACFAESVAAWKTFWQQQDVVIDSTDDMDQLLLRFAQYHLNIMCLKDDPRVGIGAKGLTGEGYKGHSFWDTEIFILPYFILTMPEAARSLLRYRFKGLYGARKKAKENGYEGAMYPWEAAWIDDGEVTPLWGGADIVTGKPIPILTGMIEQHITADVAFGVQLYYMATGDERYMDECGWEILLDTARFWCSRVVWDEKRGAYVIRDVIGPDEYKEHVDNNAYTNYMAANNLKLALGAMDVLQKRADEVCARLEKQFGFDALRARISEVLQKIYLPGSDENGIVPQFDGYFELEHVDLTRYKNADRIGTIYEDYNPEQMNRLQVHKQADTLVLMLLKDDLFPHDVKVKNYYFYEARTLHDSSLSKSTHCVLAADLGEKDTAYRFYQSSVAIDLGPNMSTSNDGVHTASMGGIWQGAVYGFGGVRVTDGQLFIDPHLPDAWRSMEFNIVWQGQRLHITAAPGKTLVANRGSVPVEIVLCGRKTVCPAGVSVRGGVKAEQ